MVRNTTWGVVAFLVIASTAATISAQDMWLNTYGQGVHAYFAGDLGEAKQHFTAAIDGGTRDPRALYFRGFSYLKSGQFDEAKADFQQGAILEVLGRNGQGYGEFFSGDFEQAHNLLTAAINEGADDPHVFYLRGLTYERLSRPFEAIADFHRAHDLGITDDQRSYPVGRSLQRLQGHARMELERFRRRARLATWSRLARLVALERKGG